MWSDMKLDHGKVVKKTDTHTHRQRLANYNIDIQGVPSQNVFLKGLKMSENQYVDKKKDSSIITKPHHLT